HRQTSVAGAGKFLQTIHIPHDSPPTKDEFKWFRSEMEATPLSWIGLPTDEEAEIDNVEEQEQILGFLILDKTCFYSESGGQIGDWGTIRWPAFDFTDENTVKNGNIVFHIGRFTRGTFTGGEVAHLRVSPEREFTRKNHTATHLLHWALREVLGDHVEQRGSKVKPDEFTFDFEHAGPVTPEQMNEVERLVNEKIYENLRVTWRELPIQEAKKLPGVRQLFGEKYGDVVRVVEIGDGFSREFCGGTHLDYTGQAGFFTIVQEDGVAKGVRRLTCRTARGAVEFVQKELLKPLLALVDRLHCKFTDLPKRVDILQEEVKKLQQQRRKGTAGDLQSAADRLLAEA